MRFIFNEEQILRLKQRLSKEKINEDALDDLISKGKAYLDTGINAAKDFISGLDINVQKKSQDIPGKADYIGDNVKDFYEILESIDSVVKQQKYGSMSHQQSVEAVQIALQILGYELPKFGTDGLFGPETADAVNKYKQDKNIQDFDDTEENNNQSNLEEMVMAPPLPIESGKNYRWNEKRSYETHQGIDIPAKVGTPIKAIADGKVVGAGNLGSMCGDGISIEHADGFTSGYCHLSGIKVKKGDVVKVGDVIGLSGGAKGASGSGNSTGPHLHLTLKKNGIKVNPLDFFGTSIGSYYDNGDSGIQIGGASITPEMVKEIISDLKDKNITSEDIKKYIDPATTTGGSIEFTDLDLTTDEGYNAYKDICDNFITKRNATALVTGKMMADSAKKAFTRYRKYVPPELALSQLTLEGGLSKDTSNRPLRTKNPFNVGNTPTQDNPQASFEVGVDIYYDLIARRYLVKGKTANDLINDFKNDQGNAYADTGYEEKLRKLVKEIRFKNEPIYASLREARQQLEEALLLETDKREAIKRVLGFNQEWADEFHRLSDKLSVWIAGTFLQKTIETIGDNNKESVINMLNNNNPARYTPWSEGFKSTYEYILHWFRAPRREQLNIRDLTFDNAYAMAEEWHDNLEISKQANYVESGDVFIDYRNSEGVGYYWVNLRKNYCPEEQKRMGHCATAGSGSKLISLRRINDFGEGESYLTVDYRPGGIIGDFHRHGNKKPTARFHNQIVDFLVNKRYPVTQLTRSGVYRYHDNFQLSDLSKAQLKKVYSENPALRYNAEDPNNWPEIINALLRGELKLSSFNANLVIDLVKKSEEIGNFEQFKSLVTSQVIKNIVDVMDDLPTTSKTYFLTTFTDQIVQMMESVINKGKNMTTSEFVSILRTISKNYFTIYQRFCNVIDRGFKIFNDEERTEIASQKGIKRTIFSCTDALPFIARFSDNGPMDVNGNIAVKTEDDLWGLIKQNGDVILHPQFLAITSYPMDRTNKSYLVRNVRNEFFLYNIETGGYSKVNMKG